MAQKVVSFGENLDELSQLAFQHCIFPLANMVEQCGRLKQRYRKIPFEDVTKISDFQPKRHNEDECAPTSHQRWARSMSSKVPPK